MQAGQLIPVRTNPQTQFRGTLAQNAAATLSLAPQDLHQTAPANEFANGYVDEGLAGGRTVRARLRAIGLWSIQNLAWEVWLWGSAQFNTPTVVSGQLAPIGRWSFQTGDAVQIAGAGAYFYYIEGLDQAYTDLDLTGKVHLMLVNRSATAKLAANPGAIQIQLQFEPCLGW